MDKQRPGPLPIIEANLATEPLWKLVFFGVLLPIAALIALGAWMACATPGPLGPLPPVPDISGPPLMARADGGARG